ncbi:VIT1/CCC1 transporter family protein [Sphingomonas faeni]|uniref:VIT1/CCC1 transporter family protein n=1 Tax=Sphingomonas faeni TaxID=185950 RepID=UPI0020C07E30|nr:VIT family protein [Sphingomonas faeni]MCK8455143.1 VIT family protein [Sphingomonas faeni]
MSSPSERHLVSRTGWLRAAVLGANDGIVSTASLIAGVAASGATTGAVLVAGSAAMVAGAMSMAAGEYVSVSSQADSEAADLAREHAELASDWAHEHDELAQIYVARGLDLTLAHQVAEQLMAHDAIGAHARDELGISEIVMARPVQAAFASAVSFVTGAVVPLAVVALAPTSHRLVVVIGATLVCLAILGVVGARAGGARPLRPAIRVLLWGAAAMAATAGIGHLVGTAV